MEAEAVRPMSADGLLIAACLRGEPAAWEELIDKYKRLIWSIPIRQGLSEADAADVFQNVCVQLYNELASLRSHEALRGWLIQVATRACYRIHRKERRGAVDSLDEGNVPEPAVDTRTARQFEQEQLLREAMASQKERCRELLRLLFYEEPPRSYQEIAQQLGLAVGSIGFIRGRCLKSLEKKLREMGMA